MQTKSQKRLNRDEETTAAFARVIMIDGKPLDEAILTEEYYSTHLAHIIGRQDSAEIWNDNPDNEEAVSLFEEAQKANYETQDYVLAIRKYEESIAAEASFLKPYAGLGIALVNLNTAASLNRAEQLNKMLLSLAHTGWISDNAHSRIEMNLAYLYLHRARQNHNRSDFDLAIGRYERAYERGDGRKRITLLFPFAYALLEVGDNSRAEKIFFEGVAASETLQTKGSLIEYMNKYPSLRSLLKESI